MNISYFSLKLLTSCNKRISRNYHDGMEKFLQDYPIYKNGIMLYRFYQKHLVERKRPELGISFVGETRIKSLNVPEFQNITNYTLLSQHSSFTEKIYDVVTNDKIVTYHMEELDLLPPRSRESFFYNIHPNYHSFCEKSKLPVPKSPVVFSQSSRTSSSPNSKIQMPNYIKTLDYSANIGVAVCGSTPLFENPDKWILGYFAANDFFVHEEKYCTKEDYQHYLSRSLDKSSPSGPGFLLHQPGYDINDFQIECTVNGELRQSCSGSDMIFSLPQIFSYMKRYLPLSAFELLLTGSPAGIGLHRTAPTYLKSGDIVTVSVYPIGSITTTFIDTDLDKST